MSEIQRLGRGEALVECRDVVYQYPGGQRALQSVSLELRKGEVFGLIGPNGSGKTTLVRLITGELQPTSGSVKVGGFETSEHPLEVRRQLGVVPQSAGLFEGLRVASHLAHFARLRGLRSNEVEAAIERVVRECELESLRSRRIRELSGGQKRLVLVALALLSDPEILILDEPSVGLDPDARRRVWAIIERQQDRGRTVLLTSHYLDEVERLSQRIGFLREGVLSHVGTLGDMFGHIHASVRVTERSGRYGIRGETHLFRSLGEAQQYVEAKKLELYTIGPVTLEDVYFALLGARIEEEP